ncbi:MAG: tRNA (adenosine(37)-N6)-dimethylallyltransferase MiaA [Deltaproteobacteria bacterium]|nr:tRNA (adenosine(37)-N6)-dimethylallyltransferase MiaA [Deltaproteobacteria bacterium]
MSEPARTPLVVVAGPTAAGKTQAALRLARALDGELVGADSVQVYRGFDVGSAKPTATELDGVAHHLIDVLDPNEEVDAQRYADLADVAIGEIHARGRLPVVVGGTGLWIRALLRGLVALPPVDHALRGRLEDEARRLGSPALHTRLSAIDPLAVTKIHPNDTLRIVRALEVYEQTGTPLGELRRTHALGADRYRALFCVVDRPREELSARIDARAGAMLAAGWIDEVRTIIARHGLTPRALSAVGYREVVAHLERGLPLEETQARIVSATRRYARHQRTWFRGEPGVIVRCGPEELTPERVKGELAG